MVLKYAGLDLILAGAIPLVFASLAQTFIVGGSQIDLGIGPFMALVSVVTATWLVEAPPLGLLALIALVCVYAASSFLVTLGQVPSIIATLGLSFIWIGTGYLIQPVPGGTSPAWMSALIYFQFPVVPIPVVIIAVATVLAILFNRSDIGHGSSGLRQQPAGPGGSRLEPCSLPVLSVRRGGFLRAGRGHADHRPSTQPRTSIPAPSLTLLSVTALVMGGGTLAGGIIRPFGAVCAAISLTLISLALGQFNLDNRFHACRAGRPAARGAALAHRCSRAASVMSFNDISDRCPWIWAAGGALLLWTVLMLHAGTFTFSPMLAAMISASFLLITAIGQSFAMMTGAGNVDLSMPSVITMSAFVSVWVIDGQNDLIWVGLLAGIGLGLIVGAINGLCVIVAADSCDHRYPGGRLYRYDILLAGQS